MRLSDFEKNISDKMLSKGKDYWLQGAVSKLEEREEDVFIAIVEGTEPYQTSITLKGDVIEDHDCTCPYDWEPICKHEVAMMFALREYLPKTRATRKAKKQNAYRALRENLAILSQKELFEIVREYAQHHRKFRNFIERKVFFKTGKHTKEEYTRIVRNTVEAHTGRSGFISFYNARNAVTSLLQLSEQAEKFVKQGKIQEAIPILQAILEEGTETLNHSDNSGRFFAEVVDSALRCLAKCAEKTKDETLRMELFQYCLMEAQQSRQSGWDWSWGLIEIAASLISDSKQQGELFTALEEMVRKEKEEFSREYAQQHAAEIALKILMEHGNREEQERFIHKHLQLPRIRAMAIERALSLNQIGQAKKFAHGGLEEQENDRNYHWEKTWYEFLLKIAEVEKSLPDIQKYAENIFLKYEDFECYEKLKKVFPRKKWQFKTDEFLRQSKKRNLNLHTLLEICIREQKWSKFLQLTKKHCSLDVLQQYDRHLVKHFPEELREMYQKQVKNGLLQTTGRKHYQRIAEVLKRMKRLPDGEALVKNLIVELMQKYPTRRAMCEEFAMV